MANVPPLVGQGLDEEEAVPAGHAAVAFHLRSALLRALVGDLDPHSAIDVDRGDRDRAARAPGVAVQHSIGDGLRHK